MKKLMGLVLVVAMTTSALASAAFAGHQCDCKPCNCKPPCECPRK